MANIEDLDLEAMAVIVWGVGNRKNTRVKRKKFTHRSLLTEHRTPESPKRLDKLFKNEFNHLPGLIENEWLHLLLVKEIH